MQMTKFGDVRVKTRDFYSSDLFGDKSLIVSDLNINQYQFLIRVLC